MVMPVTREHWIEIYGGGDYKRGLETLRAEGLYVSACHGCSDSVCLGWRAERKPAEWERRK